MTGEQKLATKKAANIFALRCLNDACRALLAYEVDAHNVLYADLAWMARQQGDRTFFPCPSCGGKNIVEPETDAKGKAGHRVVRWEA